jgi:glycerophosphoryl diester phosphodiesterase
VPVRSTRSALGLLAAATVTAGVVLPASPASASATSCVPPPVAHRGDSARAPENTLPAFRAALASGVRRLELDVRFTLGDVPVLMHDPTVGRTTNGTGAVADLTLEQVRSLDAGRWFGRRFRGTKVPTLYEALSLARKRQAYVMIELKTLPTPQQMAQVLDRIRWSSTSRQITVTSFDEATVRAVQQAAPGLRTAIIDMPRYRRPSSVLQFGRAYVVNERSVTQARARSWRRAGISVRPWTVDTLRGWRRMAHDKAEAVVTNRPTAYLAWARHRCS